jgi:hypothetical protein
MECSEKAPKRKLKSNNKETTNPVIFNMTFKNNSLSTFSTGFYRQRQQGQVKNAAS